MLIIVIAGLAYYASTQKERMTQKEEVNTLDQMTESDTTESIDSSLKEIDIESGLDVDMESIDKELKVL
ncbi:MAG: hypothetical protein KBD48_00135 [Candidatus Pacebacteria bacterium]|nr:hypothetical protein [Candidatus Paceibacterota bacterium]MBP9715588.1 hypothetical protein [Candidatus Paceibacterota bacterium]